MLYCLNIRHIFQKYITSVYFLIRIRPIIKEKSIGIFQQRMQTPPPLKTSHFLSLACISTRWRRWVAVTLKWAAYFWDAQTSAVLYHLVAFVRHESNQTNLLKCAEKAVNRNADKFEKLTALKKILTFLTKEKILYYDHGHRKGGSWSPGFWKLQQKSCFLGFKWKKISFTFGPPLKNFVKIHLPWK